jgi:hypothetical protein
VAQKFLGVASAAALLMTAIPAFAQGPDVEQMLDGIMKNAPPDLQRKMEGEMRRQAEGRPEPIVRGPEQVEIRVPPGPVDVADFLSGYWVDTAFRVECETGRPQNGPYIHGTNHRFEVRDGEIWQYDRTWGGPGYNFTYRTRYRIRDIDETRKDASSYAKQVALIRVERIESKLIEGRGSPTGPRLTEIALLYANQPRAGFEGRQVGNSRGHGFLYSCSGQFEHYDGEPEPTRGLGG